MLWRRILGFQSRASAACLWTNSPAAVTQQQSKPQSQGKATQAESGVSKGVKPLPRFTMQVTSVLFSLSLFKYGFENLNCKLGSKTSATRVAASEEEGGGSMEPRVSETYYVCRA